METIVFATHNKNKLIEIKEMAKCIPGMENFNIVSMSDVGITSDIIEDGNTYEENALIKAKFVYEKTGMMSFADDSGIEIDAFGGKPGIYSARFLGKDTPYSEKVKYIIDKLQGKTGDERKAHYICGMVLVFPNGIYKTTTGRLDAYIAQEPSAGDYGLDYDKIMYIPELGKTLAEIKLENDYTVSYRYKAFKAMCEILLKNQ